jgi:peptidylprolyl isomerase
MIKLKPIVTLFSICLLSIFVLEVGAQTKRRRTPKKPVAANKSAAITTPSGLTYLITKAGTGAQPKTGDTVIINYTGTLTNGLKFDSSHDRDQPFSFKLGTAQVIKGWDEGVAHLRVGDQAILVIPSELGYGSSGAGGVIPPNATLIFVVEVLEVKASR